MAGAHDRIIAAAAKAKLGPLGFVRKGRSRVWLADHGWWLGGVEFQPSSWSKGSYLNVFVHLAWCDKGSLSFDVLLPERQPSLRSFIEFTGNEAQFETAANWQAGNAANASVELATWFASLEAARTTLVQTLTPKRNTWTIYHAGVAAGLCGDAGSASALLDEVLASEWARDKALGVNAAELRPLVSDAAAFRAAVSTIVRRQRALLKLQEWEGEIF